MRIVQNLGREGTSVNEPVMIADARSLSLPFAFSAPVKTIDYLPMRPAIIIVVIIIFEDGELATAEV